MERIDIADDVYRYLAHDWGLKKEVLTDKKCEQLSDAIPVLRKSYQGTKDIPYHKEMTRRAYLAAFAPRYAYLLYHLLNLCEGVDAEEVLRPWHQKDGILCLLGGGPACEIIGLLDWLNERKIRPRRLYVVIVDREIHWRGFHSYLFSAIAAAHFRKTVIIPSYEQVEFPDRKTASDPKAISYGYTQIGLLTQARLFSAANVFSELKDHTGVEAHLKFLLSLPWERSLFTCVDSSANKWRPRISWIETMLSTGRLAQPTCKQLYKGKMSLDCDWLSNTGTTEKIYGRKPAPKWEKTVKRWAYAYRI